jgi:predicted MFS family arabinose efflux permease
MRNLLAGAASLAGAFGAAYLVSLTGFERGNSVALLVAVVAGSGALICQAVAVARPPVTTQGERKEKPRRDPGEWRTRQVRDYVLYGALLILGAGMATPFYSVRFINDLGGSPQTAATAMAVASALVTLGQGLWGRVIDSLGLRLVGAVGLAGIALVPLMWLAAASPATGVAIWLFNGFMWAGCGLATFNLMLEVSDDANRASVVAWVNTLQSPVNFAAPLAGGMLANAAGTPALFALSSLALVASWVYFLWSFPGHGRSVARSESQ